jgi:hypothetical protein
MGALTWHRLKLAAALGLAALLAACATQPEVAAMQARVPVVAKARVDGDVLVLVTGGVAAGEAVGGTISDADFKAATENSLARAGLFRGIGKDASARYSLKAFMTRQSPTYGMSFTVDLEVGWTLVENASQKVLWRKVIASRHTATVSDAFAGVNRARMGFEGAARKNIEAVLQELAQLPL